jgi:hypothetical protein
VRKETPQPKEVRIPSAEACVAGRGYCYYATSLRLRCSGGSTMEQMAEPLILKTCVQELGVAEKQRRPSGGRFRILSRGVAPRLGQWIGRADTLHARCTHPTTAKVNHPCLLQSSSIQGLSEIPSFNGFTHGRRLGR